MSTADLARARAAFQGKRRPEELLLFALARPDVTAEGARDVVRLARSVPDWERVFLVARSHQVAPLVGRHLARLGLLERLPDPVRESFTAEARRVEAEKAALAATLERALEYFAGQRIEVLLLKSAALDRTVYERPGDTSSLDVDLLLGASWEDTKGPVYERIVEMNRARPNLDVHCEKHPDLVMNGLLTLDFRSLWAAAREVRVGPWRAWVPGAEDLLITTCINSCRKRFFRLKSLCDLAAILERHPAIDWQALAARGRPWHCNRIVHTALYTAHLALGTPLSAESERVFGVPALQGRLVRALASRMSFTSLESLNKPRWRLGRNPGPGLLLHYASQEPGQIGRSVAIVLRQLLQRLREGGPEESSTT